jgi:hypothetical protein
MRGEFFFENFWNVLIVNMMGGEFFCGYNDIFYSPLRYRKSKAPQELRILLAVSSHTEQGMGLMGLMGGEIKIEGWRA